MLKLLSRLVNLGKSALLVDKVGAGAEYLKNKAGSLFEFRKSKRGVKFEELSDFGVTPSQIRVCKKQFFKLACFYLAFAIFLFLYVGVMLAKRQYGVALMVSSLMAICLAQAFKYHFWYFQIREQRLGCSLGEWAKFLLRKVN